MGMRQFISVLSLGLAGLFPATGWAADIPPQLQPGAIIQQQLQQSEIQRESPWLNRPLTEEDLEPPPLPEIPKGTQEGVQGEITAPTPEDDCQCP